ncbi:bifunctional UDP-sugar hydrolase/5'-nucleotidase [Jiulongibacter sediminis]|uniref:bifunctional metallophosphatase/5'-nucleotidase n=1 Tax=Jiulongibacter sediminis TaxID=1605367 RepID=UPI0026EA0E3D|nr:bifunctional metallophosphatase/5'-nucleotidase [Jiulongibacter sediminis]
MSNNRRDFLKKSVLSGLATTLPVAGVLAGEKNEKKANAKPESGTITLLQSTDVHCQIHPHDELFWENEELTFRKTGGYAHMATLINEIRKENPNTITIDTGDMFQGSELSDRTQGDALVPILNEINYDIYTPGNWEVIYYKQKMQRLLGGLNAPKVCANMFHDKGDGTPGEPIFQPYQIITKLGVKIGFLGYTDHLVPRRQPPALSKGIVYTKPEENIRHYIEVLREQEQCDFVIILSHLGLSQQIALANNPHCEGVDYIFGGDTHERIRKPIECKYAKVVEPGAFSSFVGRLDLKVKNGKIVGEKYELIEVKPDKYPADKKVAEIIKKHEKPYLESINEVVGYSTIPLYRNFVIENTMDTMVIDALKWKTGVDIALSNGFRFCPPRTPNKDGLVPITQGYLFDMLPVNSPVRIGTIKGEMILPWLERELENVFAKEASRRFGGWVVKFRGMELEFYGFKPFGEKVAKVTIGGKPIDPEKDYTVCACEREGDPDDAICRMRNVRNTYSESYTLHDAVREYLKEHSPVTPTPKGSLKILDGDQKLLSQVWGVDYEFS